MADYIGNRPRGLVGVWRATCWSLQGLKAAWRHESSFRLEVCLAVLLIPVAVYVGRTAIEQVLLIGSLLLVLAMELANSAIEAVIERYGNETHPLAGRAKDMGSAAVLMTMLNVAVCWLLIVLPQWL